MEPGHFYARAGNRLLSLHFLCPWCALSFLFFRLLKSLNSKPLPPSPARTLPILFRLSSHRSWGRLSLSSGAILYTVPIQCYLLVDWTHICRPSDTGLIQGSPHTSLGATCGSSVPPPHSSKGMERSIPSPCPPPRRARRGLAAPHPLRSLNLEIFCALRRGGSRGSIRAEC